MFPKLKIGQETFTDITLLAFNILTCLGFVVPE